MAYLWRSGSMIHQVWQLQAPNLEVDLTQIYNNALELYLNKTRGKLEREMRKRKGNTTRGTEEERRVKKNREIPCFYKINGQLSDRLKSSTACRIRIIGFRP